MKSFITPNSLSICMLFNNNCIINIYYLYMFLLLIFFSISLVLVSVLKLVGFLVSEKSMLMREEISSYECGFEHHNVSRVPFSLRYFFLTLIFLLFDLEIVLIMFVPFLVFSVSHIISLFILLLFIFILYISLIYEWNDGRLEWVS